MKIRSVTLHNWRSVKNATISMQDLMIFIGQNNHGKSNIIAALLFFFGQTELKPLDFNTDCNELYIELTFDQLNAHDRELFKRYLTPQNTITVRKQAIRGKDTSYHGYVRQPKHEWLRKEYFRKFLRRDIAKTLPLAPFLPPTGRITKTQFRQAQKKYIAHHRKSLRFTNELERGNFMGPASLAKGLFGDIYFVPSVSNAANGVTRASTYLFGELYTRVITEMAQSNPVFKAARKNLTSLIDLLSRENQDGSINTSRPKEISHFEQSLKQELEHWNTRIEIEIEPPNIEDMFKLGTNVWIDDGVRTDISQKGLGFQRSLVFALVRALAYQMKQEKKDKVDKKKSTKQRGSQSTYFLMEEPELYLHPQAQRELYDSLVDLSQSNCQVVLSTHSSSFITIEDYKSICIVRKISIEQGTTVFQCTEELFKEHEDRETFKMMSWINPTRGEMFFAQKVILVEGPTDKTIIPLLASRLGVFRYEYTVIECGGKSSMSSYIHLLNKFKIPYVVVFDSDHQAYKPKDVIKSADSLSRSIVHRINNRYGSHVVFETDIEEELGIFDPVSKHKPYVALQHIKSRKFKFTDGLKEKIKIIYE